MNILQTIAASLSCLDSIESEVFDTGACRSHQLSDELILLYKSSDAAERKAMDALMKRLAGFPVKAFLENDCQECCCARAARVLREAADEQEVKVVEEPNATKDS